MPILKDSSLTGVLNDQHGIMLVIDFIKNQDLQIDCSFSIRSLTGEEIITKTDLDINYSSWDEVKNWQQFYSDYQIEKDKPEFKLTWHSKFLAFIFEVTYPVASLLNAVVKLYVNYAQILGSYKWPGKGPIGVEMLVTKTELDSFIEELNQQLVKLI